MSEIFWRFSCLANWVILVRWKVLVLLLVSAGFIGVKGDSLFPNISNDIEVSKTASFICKKDRKRLEYFFRRFIFWEDGGYVLMGSKPCSIAPLRDPGCLNSQFLSSLMPSNLRFWLGWKTWKKYERYFPHPSFSIVQEKQENGTSLLLLINKNEFLNVVVAHRDDFEKTCQRSMDPNQMLIEAESKPLLGGILQGNDFLIGILLGYGRKNSWLYYRKTKFSEKITPLVSFTQLQENEHFANYIASEGIWGFATGSLFRDLSQMPLPGFSVDPNDSETISLNRKYRESRQKLIEYFGHRNFLDGTLELLTEPLRRN